LERTYIAKKHFNFYKYTFVYLYRLYRRKKEQKEKMEEEVSEENGLF